MVKNWRWWLALEELLTTDCLNPSRRAHTITNLKHHKQRRLDNPSGLTILLRLEDLVYVYTWVFNEVVDCYILSVGYDMIVQCVLAAIPNSKLDLSSGDLRGWVAPLIRIQRALAVTNLLLYYRNRISYHGSIDAVDCYILSVCTYFCMNIFCLWNGNVICRNHLGLA